MMIKKMLKCVLARDNFAKCCASDSHFSCYSNINIYTGEIQRKLFDRGKEGGGPRGSGLSTEVVIHSIYPALDNEVNS